MYSFVSSFRESVTGLKLPQVIWQNVELLSGNMIALTREHAKVLHPNNPQTLYLTVIIALVLATLFSLIGFALYAVLGRKKKSSSRWTRWTRFFIYLFTIVVCLVAMYDYLLI